MGTDELRRRIGDAIGDDRHRLHEGDEYRHRKTGRRYVLLGVALVEKLCTPAAMYRSLDDGIAWVRPVAEFKDRFERIGPPDFGPGGDSEAPEDDPGPGPAPVPATPSDADRCRANGWVVGTVIEGRETYINGSWSESRIRITAIGEEGVLAREVARRSSLQPVWGLISAPEASWTLAHRDWRAVGR